MQLKDLLRGTVLLIAAVATALAVAAMLAMNAAGTGDGPFLVILGWWLVAIAIGAWAGAGDRAARALAGPLAAARTSTTLPSESPGRIALARLWPLLAFAALAAGLGAFFPQIPGIAAGAGLLFALSWRRREAAVTAIEERDGVCFFVEYGHAFEPLRLIRTPGLMRGEKSSVHPPPPPAG